MTSEIKFTFQGFVIWLLCATFFLYEFLLRTIVGTFQNPIMHDFNLTSFKFSVISTTSNVLVYGLMQLPAAIFVNYYGLKKSLFIGAVLCALSVLGFANTSDYFLGVIFRMLTGLGSSCGFICMLMSVYEWMPSRNSAFIIGISQFIGTIGPIVAAGPVHSLAESGDLNWRHIFIALALFGAVLSVLVLLFVKNNQNKVGNYIILKHPGKSRDSFFKLFTRPQPWVIAIVCASTYVAIEYLSENEGKEYITLKGHSATFASYLITLSWVGYGIACPFIGYLSDRIQRRKILIVVAAFIAFVALSLILLAENEYLLIIAFLALGVGASGQSLGFSLMAEQFKKEYLAIGIGMNNAMITTFNAANAPVLGLLIDHAKTGEVSASSDYNVAFITLILFSFIGFALALWKIKETFCKSMVDYTYLKCRH